MKRTHEPFLQLQRKVGPYDLRIELFWTGDETIEIEVTGLPKEMQEQAAEILSRHFGIAIMQAAAKARAEVG